MSHGETLRETISHSGTEPGSFSLGSLSWCPEAPPGNRVATRKAEFSEGTTSTSRSQYGISQLVGFLFFFLKMREG